MTIGLNTWDDISSIAQSVQEDAYFVVRESYLLPGLVTQFGDMRGGNTRKSYAYTQLTAGTLGEHTDMQSTLWTPAEDQTLTPHEIGLMGFVTDLRRDSEAPENIITDMARELGFAAADKVETDIYGDFASLTGGTVGSVTQAPTWGVLSAAIAQARHASKNNKIPLACVIHGYSWQILAKAASIAATTSMAQAPGFTEDMTRNGYVTTFDGVPIYQIWPDTEGTGAGTAGTAWSYGAVFPRSALALDWRRPVRVEGERNASLRGTEFNMSAVYAHGVWRPTLGVQILQLANVPAN
jgi:hypothetical protein